MIGRIIAVERLNAWMAEVSSWTLLAMTLIVGFEVLSRYAFNEPTIWAWDINVQLMLMLLMLGVAEAYKGDAHVRVDVFTAALPVRAKAFLEIVLAPVFFFIAGVIAWTGWIYFLDSYNRGQIASTIFAPPLYPIKFLLPLGGALLLLQGIVKLICDLHLAVTGTPAGCRRQA